MRVLTQPLFRDLTRFLLELQNNVQCTGPVSQSDLSPPSETYSSKDDIQLQRRKRINLLKGSC